MRTSARQVPASVYGIQKYLSSGLIKGIGRVMAKRTINVFSLPLGLEMC